MPGAGRALFVAIVLLTDRAGTAPSGERSTPVSAGTSNSHDSAAAAGAGRRPRFIGTRSGEQGEMGQRVSQVRPCTSTSHRHEYACKVHGPHVGTTRTRVCAPAPRDACKRRADRSHCHTVVRFGNANSKTTSRAAVTASCTARRPQGDTGPPVGRFCTGARHGCAPTACVHHGSSTCVGEAWARMWIWLLVIGVSELLTAHDVSS